MVPDLAISCIWCTLATPQVRARLHAELRFYSRIRHTWASSSWAIFNHSRAMALLDMARTWTRLAVEAWRQESFPRRRLAKKHATDDRLTIMSAHSLPFHASPPPLQPGS
jgi:hypothetical protein